MSVWVGQGSTRIIKKLERCIFLVFFPGLNFAIAFYYLLYFVICNYIHWICNARTVRLLIIFLRGFWIGYLFWVGFVYIYNALKCSRGDVFFVEPWTSGDDINFRLIVSAEWMRNCSE